MPAGVGNLGAKLCGRLVDTRSEVLRDIVETRLQSVDPRRQSLFGVVNPRRQSVFSVVNPRRQSLFGVLNPRAKSRLNSTNVNPKRKSFAGPALHARADAILASSRITGPRCARPVDLVQLRLRAVSRQQRRRGLALLTPHETQCRVGRLSHNADPVAAALGALRGQVGVERRSKRSGTGDRGHGSMTSTIHAAQSLIKRPRIRSLPSSACSISAHVGSAI